jgi:hypothetical protein
MLYRASAFLLFTVTLLIAGRGIAAERRHAEAHVHGVAEINILVEGKRIVVEFHTPTEGVMGFEHEAKSDAEKKKRDAALKLIDDKFAEMVILEGKLGCRSQSGKIAIVQSDFDEKREKKDGHADQKKSGEHREVRATFNVECQQNPAGSQVRFGVSKVFPGIQEVKVQVLSDAKQSGVTIKNDKGYVQL